MLLFTVFHFFAVQPQSAACYCNGRCCLFIRLPHTRASYHYVSIRRLYFTVYRCSHSTDCHAVSACTGITTDVSIRSATFWFKASTCRRQHLWPAQLCQQPNHCYNTVNDFSQPPSTPMLFQKTRPVERSVIVDVDQVLLLPPQPVLVRLRLPTLLSPLLQNQDKRLPARRLVLCRRPLPGVTGDAPRKLDSKDKSHHRQRESGSSIPAGFVVRQITGSTTANDTVHSQRTSRTTSGSHRPRLLVLLRERHNPATQTNTDFPLHPVTLLFILLVASVLQQFFLLQCCGYFASVFWTCIVLSLGFTKVYVMYYNVHVFVSLFPFVFMCCRSSLYFFLLKFVSRTFLSVVLGSVMTCS